MRFLFRLRLRTRTAAAGMILLGGVAPTAPATAGIHQLSGNVRFQVGNGLPQPITVAPIPMGAVVATPLATVDVLTAGGTVPPPLAIGPGRLTAPGSPFTLPVHLANSNLFQVASSLAAQFPASTAIFRPGGRTGAATVTLCPGFGTITTGVCPPPGAGVLPGLVRYTRTANQFGGPARAAFQGRASFAVAGAPAPCAGAPTCFAVFGGTTPAGGLGGPLATFAFRSNPPPSPGAFYVTVTAGGLITNVGTPLGIGYSNPRTTYAGPWTTGVVSVSQPSASPPELFVFSGSDARSPGGQGAISLVSGGVVQTPLSGVHVARGWLNLTVLPEPSLLPGAVCGAAALLGRARWRLRRRSVR